MTQYVIYNNPTDYPGKFVVREWIIQPGKFTAKDEILSQADTLVEARATLPKGLTQMPIFDQDDPVISEVWDTPATDIGFWYKNIKTSYDELTKVPKETSQLERTNILMKLRESLLDHEKDGDSVTTPAGISVFPNNLPYFWFGWLSGILAVIGVIVGLVGIGISKD